VNDRLRIVPFNGYRYDPEKVPDLTGVIAPPYDMISPAAQERLYGRHPLNVVRLILARDREEGSAADRYERAAATYRQWKQERILVQDTAPSIYAYRQDFEWDGRTYQRLGFISRVALTEFGKGAFPHESTLSGPKADRLRLMLACHANFSSIFSLFSDREGKVLDRLEAETASSPLVRVRDDMGVVHCLWQLSRPEFHSWLNEQMREKQFIIADGHHRYETALEYRRLMGENPRGRKGDQDYVMMFLAPIESPGLRILPFHRLLDVGSAAVAVTRLAEAFDITAITLPGDSHDASAKILGFLEKSPEQVATMVLYDGGPHAHGLTMKKDFDTTSYLRPGTSPRVGALDVTVLHQVVLEGLLGLDEQKYVQEGRIAFFSKPDEAVEGARKGNKVAFFLRPTKIDQVWDIAVSGQKMPQKSTNFYPKLTSGLVINQL